MTNDETRPLPAQGPAPARAEGARVDAANGTSGAAVPPPPVAPPSPWATTKPVAPPPSPYGPAVPAPDGEPDPWVDITPGRVDDGPAFGAPDPGQAGQGRRVLGVVGLVAAGAVAGALIVSAVGGFGGSNTAAVQPAGIGQNGAGQNGAGQNGVAPGSGVQGGAPGAQGGVQDGVPGGQGLRGGFGGQDGEQRLTGTVTAVSGSRLTVRTSSGSATYQLVSQTQIVRDGAVASASDLKVGDRVLVHVFPANGSDGVLERVIAVTGSATGSGTASTQDSDGTETCDT